MTMEISDKQPVLGRIVKLLGHVNTDRNMTLIPERSRCVRQFELHELVVTDECGLNPGDRVQRVGFLGFAEITRAGVIEVGDQLELGCGFSGSVIGFDSCHHPNHYNIIVQARRLLSAPDLDLHVGDALTVSAQPAARSIEVNAELPTTIIVGLGRSGRLLHLPCVLRAREMLFGAGASSRILAFDPYSRLSLCRRCSGRDSPETLDSFSAVPHSLRSQAIVHVCTPPNVRTEVVAEAADLGMRHFILEKPMADTMERVAELRALAERYSLRICVVSNLTASALTRALKQHLERTPRHAVRHLGLRHVKSRISRSLANSSHQSAFDVEMPHMLSLSCFLLGSGIRVRNASHWDLQVHGATIPGMGGAQITLTLPGGGTASLHADHMSPRRERSIEIRFDDNTRLKGFYPCGSDDLYSQLHRFDSRGALVERQYFTDDTLTQFLLDGYRYFLGMAGPPLSDLDFNSRVCRLLDHAKRLSAAAMLIEPCTGGKRARS